MRHKDYADILAEFDWTRPRHGGRATLAAPILGTTPAALTKLFQRARAEGFEVEFIDDTKGSK